MYEYTIHIHIRLEPKLGNFGVATSEKIFWSCPMTSLKLVPIGKSNVQHRISEVQPFTITYYSLNSDNTIYRKFNGITGHFLFLIPFPDNGVHSSYFGYF